MARLRSAAAVLGRALPLLLLLGLAPCPRAQQGETSPSADAERPADPAVIRADWRKLPPEEKRTLEQSWRRWKALSRDDRDVLVRRHRRLDDARARLREQLPADAQRQLDGMDELRRHRELTQRALRAARDDFDQLPPELHERVKRELGALPLRQRERALRGLLAPYVEAATAQQLREMVDRGALPSAEVAALEQRLREHPEERIPALREFVADHADAFRVPPDVAQKLRNGGDPRAGLRMIDKFRRRLRGDGPPPFGPPRPPRPRDGRSENGPPREGAPPRGG